MDRRAFIRSAAGGLLAVPVASMAQQAGRSYRVCWLSSLAARTESYNLALVARLRELGFVEGSNLVIEYRSAEGRTERLAPLAAELARQRCDLFLAPGTEANVRAVEQASRDAPIVVVATDYDPVATRHVASLARPGGRITGVSHLQSDLPAKRIELLKQFVPGAKTIGVLSDTVSADQLALTQAAAARLGVALAVHEFKRAPYDYERAFAGFAQAKADAFLAMASGLFVAARQTIPALATKHRLPSMFNNRLWVESGGLLSYGVNFSTSYRRAAEQIAMILNGTKPADIPMEQASAVELVVNLKTARTLGIAVPPAVLARADEVIQ